jgi:hypothetical protein
MELIKKNSGPSKCAKSLMLEKVKLRRMTEMKPPPRWGKLSRQLTLGVELGFGRQKRHNTGELSEQGTEL